MRKIADENHTALNVSESFQQVSDRLEQVYQGLGEVIGRGVGDLSA